MAQTDLNTTTRRNLTLRELAAELELSPTTVSRALNGYPEVSDRTRRRVEEAARRFNYRPNRNARFLAKGRTGVVGILFPAARNLLYEPVFTEFLAGVSEFVSVEDYDIALRPTSALGEIDEYRQMIETRRIDGLIVSAPRLRDPRIERLAELGFPFILHGRTEDSAAHAWLDIDNHGAFAQATRLLCDLGHRRIALINGDDDATFAVHREQGVRETLAGRGLDPGAAVCLNGSMTEEDGYQGARESLTGAAPVTAILASSVFCAFGALRAIRELGLRPGVDVSLISHDDGLPYLQPEKLDPPLTVTRSPVRAAGRRVAEMLHERISDASVPPRQELWAAELIVRDSTGPAPVS